MGVVVLDVKAGQVHRSIPVGDGHYLDNLKKEQITRLIKKSKEYFYENPDSVED